MWQSGNPVLQVSEEAVVQCQVTDEWSTVRACSQANSELAIKGEDKDLYKQVAFVMENVLSGIITVQQN